MVGEQRREMRRVPSSGLDQARQLFELFQPDGSRHFKRSDVVAGQHEAEHLIEGVVRDLADPVLARKLARPTVGAGGQQDVVQFLVVSDDQPPSIVECGG
jgi:hypothetical protein